MTEQDFYDKRQTAKAELAAARADRLEAEGARRTKEASEFFRGLQGQPILIDHHSGRADANRRRKKAASWDKGVEQLNQAAAIRDRTGRANTAIASDDPKAADQLSAKLAAVTAERDELKGYAAAYRKARNAEAKRVAPGWGMTPKEAQRAIESADWQLRKLEETDTERVQQIREARTLIYSALDEAGVPSSVAHEAAFGNALNQFGVPGWQISNLTAKVKATAKRLEEVSAIVLVDEDWEQTGVFSDGTEWVCTLEDGRYRIESDKPAREVTQALRAQGFKWSRAWGVWQLKVTPAAQESIDRKLGALGASSS